MKPTRSPVMKLAPFLSLFLLIPLLAMSLCSKPAQRESHMIGAVFPGIYLPILNDPKQFMSPLLWKNQPVIINVFASWCQPCAIEHPLLMKLAQENQIRIYGIAWRDKDADTAEWLRKRGNPYQYIGLDRDGATTVMLSLSGVPETFILDRSGRIVFHHKSPLDEQIIQQKVLPLIKQILPPNAS